MILALLLACTRPPDPHYPHADVLEDSGNSETATTTTTDTGHTGKDTRTPPTDTGGVTHEVVPCEVNKPILLDMFRHDSVNGEYWMEPTWIMGNTSVPDLLVDGRVDHGQPTLFWMSFEDRKDLCDRLAYATFNLATNEVGAIEAVGFLELPPTKLPPDIKAIIAQLRARFRSYVEEDVACEEGPTLLGAKELVIDVVWEVGVGILQDYADVRAEQAVVRREACGCGRLMEVHRRSTWCRTCQDSGKPLAASTSESVGAFQQGSTHPV